jgi:thioredoxin reductase (NADPH)
LSDVGGHATDRLNPADCAVVGGGPAGLSAAIYLGRLRRSSVVFDDRAGRSLWSQVNRNYLGFPEGIEAAELRRLGREHAARYGAAFVGGTVETIARDGSLFRLAVAEPGEPDAGSAETIRRDEKAASRLGEARIRGRREAYARTVILATGVRDEFPEFAGRDECVGRTLFWCLICDGYEALDRHALVVGHDEEAVSSALQLREFTDWVTLVAGRHAFTVPPERLRDLADAGIAAFAAPIAEYGNEDGCINAVRLDDAEVKTIPVDLVYSIGPRRPRSDLAGRLGVALDENGYVVVDTEQHTNVPAFFAAGDVTRPHNHQITSAAHEGGMAAAAANYYLYGETQKDRSGSAVESRS